MLISAGQMRSAIKDLPDDAPVTIEVEYDEVCNDYVFLRLESILPLTDGTSGVKLIVSLVDGKDDEDDEENTD